MKKLWQRLLRFVRGAERDELITRIRALEATINTQNYSMALLDNNLKLEANKWIRTIIAIVLQNGGEYVLDHAFVDMLDNPKTDFKIQFFRLHPDNPADMTMYYKIIPDDSSDEVTHEQPNGYDLPEDDGCKCCPDNDCCGGCN